MGLCKIFMITKKSVMLFLLLAVSVMVTACNSDVTPDREHRASKAGAKTSWTRPASWEGGLPGMGGVNTPNQY